MYLLFRNNYYYYTGKSQVMKAWIQRLTQRMFQVEDWQGSLVNTASMKRLTTLTILNECVIINSYS